MEVPFNITPIFVINKYWKYDVQFLLATIALLISSSIFTYLFKKKDITMRKRFVYI